MKRCDEHYTIVACKPGTPGAYAACTADPAYDKHAREFVMRELSDGATVQKVTCNRAQKLLDEYCTWSDQKRDKRKERRK